MSGSGHDFRAKVAFDFAELGRIIERQIAGLSAGNLSPPELERLHRLKRLSEIGAGTVRVQRRATRSASV